MNGYPLVLVIITFILGRIHPAVCEIVFEPKSSMNPCEYDEHKRILRQSPSWRDESYQLYYFDENNSDYTSRTCYLVSKVYDQLTNRKAEKACHEVNGHIASFSKIDELNFLEEKIIDYYAQDSGKQIAPLTDAAAKRDFRNGPTRYVISPQYDERRLANYGFRYKSYYAAEFATSLGGVSWQLHKHRFEHRHTERAGKQAEDKSFACNTLQFNKGSGRNQGSSVVAWIDAVSCDDSDTTDYFHSDDGSAVHTKEAKGRGVICEFRMSRSGRPAPAWGDVWSDIPNHDYKCDSDHRLYKRRKCKPDLSNPLNVVKRNTLYCTKGTTQDAKRYTGCIYRPPTSWAAWGSWSGCNGTDGRGRTGRKQRYSQCIQPEKRTATTHPQSCDEIAPLRDEVACDCGIEYWSSWTECIEGQRSRSRCGRIGHGKCEIEIHPSWSDWGLWTECDYGVRKRSRECFVDRTKVDSSKPYYNFLGCAVTTTSESGPCEDTCTWLDFGIIGKTFTYSMCYTIVGIFFASLCLIWCLCLTCGCGKKEGIKQLNENLANFKKIQQAKSTKSKGRKSTARKRRKSGV